MIVATLMLMQAAAAGGARYDACLSRTQVAAAEAVALANAWLVDGGGLAARHCLGVALMADGKPAAAADTLEAAARAAETVAGAPAADIYGQAGNAALLAGDLPRAERLLSSAIIAAANLPGLAADLHVDRARVRVELMRPGEARADLDAAARLAPDNWAAQLLLATLARREDRLADAGAAMARALALAPDAPDVLLEAGNVAALTGDRAAARRHWQKILALAPGTPVATAADDALVRNPE
jgi:tetratricopeptide (TPR) repeat protein